MGRSRRVGGIDACGLGESGVVVGVGVGIVILGVAILTVGSVAMEVVMKVVVMDDGWEEEEDEKSAARDMHDSAV